MNKRLSSLHQTVNEKSPFAGLTTFKAVENFAQGAAATYPASQYREFLEAEIAQWRFKLKIEVHGAPFDHVRHAAFARNSYVRCPVNHVPQTERPFNVY
ncbi:hypothetical protein CIC12_12535 [Burkholderia sp. SG-MS1]|uniref:hypothetical protein n=1 Tax=Paraburkholderia sp. SG-MS1 TaxID=2023741 RepID=UPI0014454BB4|nr:hypothetical protein [Paraburkholderia sp. SG-MS1]NKJ47554.1 hypothetical protein [Paraburkholderia sp. SG-MS1]